MINVSNEFKKLMEERQDFKCNAEVILANGTVLTLGEDDFSIDNKPKLRNCPFCGNKAYLIGLFVSCDDDEINEYQVGCEECGIHFNQSWEYDTIVDLWNGEYYKNE